MNWRCLFGKHDWEHKKLPFTDQELRDCTQCPKMEILTPTRWIPFEGSVAVVGLTFALGEMKRRIDSSGA